METSSKIRIYPDERQRSVLNRWFGAARYAYNRSIDMLTAEDADPIVKMTASDNVLQSYQIGTERFPAR